jgi:glycosyltransferase involved in cell wall biosynthesis
MRVAFVAPIRHLASMPFAVEAIRSLAERGHEVDVMIPSRTEPKFVPPHRRCRAVTYRQGESSVDALFLSVVRLLRTVRACGRRVEYDAAIGLSQKGLVAAAMMLGRRVKSVVYLNDEIWYGPEGGSWWATRLVSIGWKWLERRYCRRVSFSVTQDSGRARLLAEVNRIPIGSVMLLPNSPSGRGSRIRSRYLAKRLNLSEDSVILLWAGMIPSYGCALELVEESSKWPSQFKLVLHTRMNAQHDPFLKRLMTEAEPERVKFSLQPVPYEEVGSVVGSADIGLALYANSGSNAREMGLSSGKVNHYLKAGVPVIAQDFPGLRWVEEEGCGICVSGPREVAVAAETILRNYDAFAENAVRTFNELLSFDRAFEKIAERLERECGEHEASSNGPIHG